MGGPEGPDLIEDQARPCCAPWTLLWESCRVDENDNETIPEDTESGKISSF